MGSMKSLYIAFLQLQEGSGITRKIVAQYEALKEAGLDINFCIQKLVNGDLCYVVNENVIIDNLGNGKFANARTFYRYGKLFKYIIDNKIKFVYIRYALNATPFFIDFLKKLKNNGVCVYMEIPTFPYDGELLKDGVKHRLECYIEKISRNYFRKYIDKVVTFSMDMEIFGVPTIQISNAVDPEGIRLRTPQIHEGINMIAVAMLNFWHGYDRLINGLHNYYSTEQSQNVHLYIVGKGVVLQEYEQLVKKYGLEEKVTFSGVLYGDALDDLFDISDVGIGSLGRHRNGITQLKTLKNVEYAVRGLPFVYSENNPDFDNQSYVYKASADESALNIKNILDFLHGQNLCPESIRESVVSELSWNSQMKKVVENLHLLMKE